MAKQGSLKDFWGLKKAQSKNLSVFKALFGSFRVWIRPSRSKHEYCCPEGTSILWTKLDRESGRKCEVWLSVSSALNGRYRRHFQGGIKDQPT